MIFKGEFGCTKTCREVVIGNLIVVLGPAILPSVEVTLKKKRNL